MQALLISAATVVVLVEFTRSEESSSSFERCGFPIPQTQVCWVCLASGERSPTGPNAHALGCRRTRIGRVRRHGRAPRNNKYVRKWLQTR